MNRRLSGHICILRLCYIQTIPDSFVSSRDHTGYGFCSQTRTVISVVPISKVKSRILERQGCLVLVQLLTRSRSSLTTSP